MDGDRVWNLGEGAGLEIKFGDRQHKGYSLNSELDKQIQERTQLPEDRGLSLGPLVSPGGGCGRGTRAQQVRHVSGSLRQKTLQGEGAIGQER